LGELEGAGGGSPTKKIKHPPKNAGKRVASRAAGNVHLHMHLLEPFYDWRNLYAAEDDERSPFFGRQYSELFFSNTVYDHYIHPQWDAIGSPTLFVKILYADYDEGYVVIEMMGEWNDAIHNDIMTLKRDVVDLLLQEGVNKFVLIGENVLNFHCSDDCYYEEWFEDLDDGWIVLTGFREHVLREMAAVNADSYFVMGGNVNVLDWRTYRPMQLYERMGLLVQKRLGA
jgi:hypothetical protein